MEQEFSFICSICAKRHDGLPDLAYEAPFYYDERRGANLLEGCELTGDLCVVVGPHYFIGARLVMPVRGVSATLGWGVWVTQSETNFARYAQTLGATPEQVTFGYLANELATYPNTLSMRTRVHWQPNGFRPLIE